MLTHFRFASGDSHLHSVTMTESYNELIAATLLFVGGHFLLCSKPLRQGLIGRFGSHGARAATAGLLFASFVWLLFAYGRAPDWLLWSPPPVFAWLPLLAMPFACVLLVSAFTTPSPTGVAGTALVRDAPRSPIGGILTVTRHPMLWGTALWAFSHLFVAGSLATVIVCLGILVLSFAGMRHIDQRREAELGSAWGPVKLTTSALPFLAIAAGRCQFDWRGIGWGRLLGGLALFIALLLLHGTFTGHPLVPFR